MTTELLDISFRLMTEKTFYHSLDSSLLISDVKALIETDSEIAAENQRLIFKGQLLKDEYTLQSYGVESGSTIHVVGRPSPTTNDQPTTEPQESTTNNTQQGTQFEPDQNQQSTAGTNSRGFGFPMGIFMSPIYATISVSTPGTNPNPDSTVEQAASQFFSGVVNSFFSTFTRGATSQNNPQTTQETTTAPPEEDLLTELEESSNLLNKLTNSIKTLNNTRIFVTPSNNQNFTTSNASNNNSSSEGEGLNNTRVEQNGPEQSSENPESNFNNSSTFGQPNFTQSFYFTTHFNPSDGSFSFGEGARNPSENEDYNSRNGKILLMDPEMINSKLPWDSLNKLHEVLHEFQDNCDDSCPIFDTNDVAIRSKSINTIDISQENDLQSFSADPTSRIQVDTGESSFDDFLRRLQSLNLRTNELMREYNLGDRSSQLKRFKQLSTALAIKTRIETSLCALFSWLQIQMVSPERARILSTQIGWNSMNDPLSASNSSEQNNNPSNAQSNSESGSQNQMDLDNTKPSDSQKDTQNTSTSYTELLSRYRNNPEFSSSMERVRQTELNDSYHNS